MITINRKKRTATNVSTGATCDIIFIDNEAYTDMAGLIALEYGWFASEQLRDIIKKRQKRGGGEGATLIKPIKINSSWWYSVEGWNLLRDEILANIENDA